MSEAKTVWSFRTARFSVYLNVQPDYCYQYDGDDPDGVVAFLPAQVPDVLAQLRAAGFIVRKAKPHKPLSAADLDAMLSELEI